MKVAGQEIGNVWSPLHEVDPDVLIHERTRPIEAIPTMWQSWNRACRDDGGSTGLAAPWFVTVAAPTGGGKSVIAGNLLAEGMKSGKRMGLISLEMLQRQIETRTLATIAGVPVIELERGPRFNEQTLRRAVQKVRSIHEETGGYLYTGSDPVYSLPGVLEAMNELAMGVGCQAIVVDYIQLAGNPNDAKSITAVSHGIRQRGRELGVVVVGLSQFNRDPFRDGRPPTIHDLMGGSSLENDSDQVVLLDTSKKERATAPEQGFYMTARVAKNRHGPSVEIPVHFDTSTLRMKERLPDEMAARRAA